MSIVISTTDAATQREMLTLGNCRFELVTEGESFLGLGAIYIGETQVRSGRLPLHPYSQSFTGHELAGLRLLGVETGAGDVRICLEAVFQPLPVKLLRDHSFDPIHETGDWDTPVVSGSGRLDLVLQSADDHFAGVRFSGFSYHYEYQSEAMPLFYLLDLASWELDGDITGATAISQSSCSAPVAIFDHEKAWTTEGVIHWEDAASLANPNMTHNLPRWASHQAFDFQYKGDKTLLGVFAHVDLIRTLLKREAGKAELKTLDKHIFDQTLSYRTSAKMILLNTDPKSATMQQNLWTWVFDEVANRARAEFALAEEPLLPKLSINFWDNFIIDDYRKDLLPAAANLGFESIFIDNQNRSAATERCPHADFHWNMCCGHEYEIAPRLGGVEMLKQFVSDCKDAGIRPFAWTNNDQALSSPINETERDDNGWFVHMEDTRLKYGGAYGNVMSILDFNREAPRRYWIDCLTRVKAQTGLDGYLFDSFYNLGFMPVSYANGTPTTQWRGLLRAFKELQDAGINFMIESFGAFGSPQHGCPVEYGFSENLFSSYKLAVGLGYTTIPNGSETRQESDAEAIYRFLAHMVAPSVPMHIDGVRIDQIDGSSRIKQALADYRTNRPQMHKRFLQANGNAVLWHNADGTRATLWNIIPQEVTLSGSVYDLTADCALPPAAVYHLRACHTYAISGGVLPTAVQSVD